MKNPVGIGTFVYDSYYNINGKIIDVDVDNDVYNVKFTDGRTRRYFFNGSYVHDEAKITDLYIIFYMYTLEVGDHVLIDGKVGTVSFIDRDPICMYDAIRVKVGEKEFFVNNFGSYLDDRSKSQQIYILIDNEIGREKMKTDNTENGVVESVEICHNLFDIETISLFDIILTPVYDKELEKQGKIVGIEREFEDKGCALYVEFDGACDQVTYDITGRKYDSSFALAEKPTLIFKEKIEPSSEWSTTMENKETETTMKDRLWSDLSGVKRNDTLWHAGLDKEVEVVGVLEECIIVLIEPGNLSKTVFFDFSGYPKYSSKHLPPESVNSLTPVLYLKKPVELQKKIMDLQNLVPKPPNKGWVAVFYSYLDDVCFPKMFDSENEVDEYAKTCCSKLVLKHEFEVEEEIEEDDVC